MPSYYNASKWQMGFKSAFKWLIMYKNSEMKDEMRGKKTSDMKIS